MKYKVGDKVRIQSLEWYQKEIESEKWCPNVFDIYWCSREMTISKIVKSQYLMEEDGQEFSWTDEMIEGLVEEETQSKEMLTENAKHYWKMINGDSKPKFKVGDKVTLDLYPCVVTTVEWKGDYKYVGYVYTVRGADFGKTVKEDDLVFDERTVPNTNEVIQLIKNDWNNFKDRYDIPDDYHFVDKNGNEINISDIVLEKKKKEYPKTFLGCCDVLNIGNLIERGVKGYKAELFDTLQKLIICRDAYWKIAGEEMGLGKPWENSRYEVVYSICRDEGIIVKGDDYWGDTHAFEFPIREMRDAFYENFKEDIEKCKELL